jgi:hypothetical protein
MLFRHGVNGSVASAGMGRMRMASSVAMLMGHALSQSAFIT